MTMRTTDHPYIVTSARFDGHGHGFCVGFESRYAATMFATFVLFGFADVLEWWQFEDKFPHYSK